MNGKNVSDLAAQCPGDKFSIDCNPLETWMSFDTVTGKISAAVPKDTKSGSTQCKMVKTSNDGQEEFSKFDLAWMGASQCIISRNFPTG